ncbi:MULTISPECIES: hypothetical protein [unclassified Streptomyces]|uniref:hypothetical protein n=1 Tax=unclassified Streptomyces TaxID=2593676 RepID=UPI0003601ABD|nr:MULTISPECIES: hypothetical protein [unclassified Streptomyces]MYX37481.1 hypothetical protein [Streptomyces sp. SID8377]
MDQDVQLVQDFVAGVPGFEDLYDAHVFNEDGILPIVFFWDVAHETVTSFLGGDAESDWRATLRFLEDQLQRDIPEVTETIAWFLYYLPWPDQPGYGLVGHLGPTMSAKFAVVRPSG